MQGRLSLRERLLVVLAAALAPLLAATLWLAVRESREAIDLAQSQLKFAASLLAAHQDRAAQGAQQMLGAVAAVPDLRQGGHARCESYFQRLRQRFDMYADIGLIGADGQLLCDATGSPDAGGASAADRDYFRNAVASRRFEMGEPLSLDGRRVLPFALPVVENGETAAVAFAMLDLGRAAAMLTNVALPQGARVVVADRRGHVLMEHPAPAGKPVDSAADPPLLEAARTLTASAGERLDADGVPRLYALAPSKPVGAEGFIVRVGMARSLAARGAWMRGRDVVAGFALLLAAAMASVWWLGGRMIVKPARQILGTVRRLEQGHLDARVPVHAPAARGEFSRIAAAFNLMAESLQLRQADVEAELERSRGAYAVLDQVLNSMQEGLIAVSADGRFLMANDAATRMFPLKDAPLLPALWPEHFGFFHADQVTPYRAEELPLVRSALGDAGGQQLVFVRNAQVPEGRLLQCSWQPLNGSSVRGGLVAFTDVTELRRLQSEQTAQFAQLSETQRKLIESQRIGRMGNWELDLATGRLWWSDEAFVLYGLPRDAFHGTLSDFEQRVHPDDRPLLKPARDRALRDGEVMNLEYRVIRPDGTIAWMHEIAETRRDASGEPIWFGGVVQDVTQRKQQEEQLQESQRELQAYSQMLLRAAEAAQAINAQPTLEETLEEVARQVCRVLGICEASVTVQDTGGPITRSFSAEGSPCAGEVLTLPLADRGGRAAGELRAQAPEGHRFTQRDRYVGIELAQLASVAIDNARLFTQVRELNAGLESRIAERTEQLARQEQLYRTLAEQAPEVVWHTDASGEVTYFNRAWYELVGGEPTDWLGQGWLARVHPEDRDEARRNGIGARASLAPYAGTRRILARDGAYHTMSYKAAPVVDANGRATSWIGIDADITHLKAVESALRSSNQELEAFSYSVSHDLRAPLAAIAGFSRALEGKIQGVADEKGLHYLARIIAGVGKMEQLIDSLLQLSRVVRAPLEWAEVDLSAMARDAVEGLQVHDPARHVRIDVEDGLVAFGDPRLLRLVVENLVGNAWKFTARTEGARIQVGRSGATEFFVRDNGVGFEMAYADKLFTAFHRLHTEAEFPGTGIGLATVRRIIVRHQGRVWAQSQPGDGTTFHFSLPETVAPLGVLARTSTPQ